MTDLINTLESPGEFDAAASLRPGEPYFLLVGRDRQAPPLVLQWSRDNRRRADDEHERGLIDDAKWDEELRKSTEAERIAWGMTEYKTGRERIEAEAPKPSNRPTYSGHQLPEETQRRDREQQLRTTARNSLSNAVGELDALRRFWVETECPTRAAEVEHRIGALREMQAEVEPPRPVFA